MSDTFGRNALTQAWTFVFGEAPELVEIQLAQAVARGESGYGLGVFHNLQTGEGQVLNNWGAVQCCKPPCNGVTNFEATDRHADGTPYQVCFKKYATPAEGASDFLKVLCLQHGRGDAGPTNVRDALRSGNVDALAHRMHETGYFELKESKYADAIWTNVQAIASNLGEPLLAFRGDPEDVSGGEASSPLSISLSSDLSDTEPSGSPKSCENDPDADELYEPTKDEET